jgi:hypothetical protein
MAVNSLVNLSRLIIPSQLDRRRNDRNSKHGVVQLNRQWRDSGGRVAKWQRNGGAMDGRRKNQPKGRALSELL